MGRADLVIFATPVYFHDLSESMKAFLDRLRRIGFPKLLRQPLAGDTRTGAERAGRSGDRAMLCGWKR